MPVVAVIGAQWGDEGKGKIVDLFAEHADIVVRYGGGANAGHTLVVNGDKVVFHLVPSGALRPKVKCVVGPGTVIDANVLLEELATLRERGLLTPGRLLLSERAHLVLPHHKLLDGFRDAQHGIGTTKRGIGPTYQDKAARRGIRLCDLTHPSLLMERLEANIDAWAPLMRHAQIDVPDATSLHAELLRIGDQLGEFIADTTEVLFQAKKKGERILLEGAQGTMLDLDHGTYPFVTSSSVTAGGACTGSGLPPNAVDRVIGITKAYTTRVGAGPFPTELEGEAGDELRKKGSEFGATTGRPRRCGWLDIPVLRCAVRVNGLNELAVTKADILSGMDELKLARAYNLDGHEVQVPPALGLERAEPILEACPGWQEDLTHAASVKELPKNCRAYLDRIAELVECPVGIVSVGPGREQTLNAKDPFSF